MIRIRVFNAHPRYRRRLAATSRLARCVLTGERKPHADCNIVFIGDRMMVQLNTAFLNHRTTTDVLSFPLAEETNRIEGEVYVNLDQAKRQARQYSATMQCEVARLVTHGLLHLTGYHDGTAAERRVMREREEYYLSSFRAGSIPCRNLRIGLSVH